jgi:cytochrome bd-type quinol oxidase subunit 2
VIAAKRSGTSCGRAAGSYGEGMDSFAALVLGLLAVLFAVAVISQASFKVRHWRDWPNRWQTAHPVIAVLLAMDLFVRAAVRDDAYPRSKRQAALWEAPSFLLGAAVVGFGLFLTVASLAP